MKIKKKRNLDAQLHQKWNKEKLHFIKTFLKYEKSILFSRKTPNIFR